MFKINDRFRGIEAADQFFRCKPRFIFISRLFSVTASDNIKRIVNKDGFIAPESSYSIFTKSTNLGSVTFALFGWKK